MSYGMSILSPNNVIPLRPLTGQSPTSRTASSLSCASPLPRVTKSSREDVVMTSPRRLSMTSPVATKSSRKHDVMTSSRPLSMTSPRDPTRPEVVMLCSGRSCLRLPVDAGSGRTGSYVSSSADGAAGVGWRVRWRPLDVSEYVVSDFGFRRQLLSQSLGMTQRKLIRSREDLEREIVSTARRHLSACQLPGAVKTSSRAATNFVDLKETLEVTSDCGGGGGHGWTPSPAESMDAMDDWNGKEWPGSSVVMKRSNSVVSRGCRDGTGSPRKRSGLCRGLTFVNSSFNSSSLSSSSSTILGSPLIIA